MALIAQFGGILDGQDMTPGYAVRNFPSRNGREALQP
jgi:hypothetical protein